MDIFSPWHLLILLVIVVLLFGTKKLGNIGTDLGKAMRGFKQAMHEGDDADVKKAAPAAEKLQADPPAAAPDGPKQAQSGSTGAKHESV